VKLMKNIYALRYRVSWLLHDYAMFPSAMHAVEFERFERIVANEAHDASVTWWVDLPDMKERETDRVFVYRAEWIR